MSKDLLLPRRVSLGLLLGLIAPVLLWLALRAVPLRDVWSVTSGLGLAQIAMLIAINLSLILAFAGRWWLILRGQGYHLPYLAVAGYRLAAFGVSYFTPGPQFGGEPLQAYLVKQRHDVPISSATASVALDKLLEMVVNFTFLAVGASLTLRGQVFNYEAGLEGLIFALALPAAPLGFLLAIWAGRRPITSLIGCLPKPLRRTDAYTKLHRLAAESEAQATQLCRRQPFSMAGALIVSLLAWSLWIAEYWLSLHFLGASLTPLQLISVLTAARLAILMPVPGGLGTLEASQVFIFGTLGLDPAVGLSAALIIRVRDVLLGGLGLGWAGMAINRT